ncbi:hypothetical protein BDW22DRAFT_1430602 [Trametopsis cervina]|nr:hypothetical protein BDW22DRAFT_1430602 [Trametopsis cervina]
MLSRSSQAVLKARPQQAAAASSAARRSVSTKADASSAPTTAGTSRTLHTTRASPQAYERSSFDLRADGIPLSAWDPSLPQPPAAPQHPWGSRRQKLAQDTYDNVIPAYYIERRRQLDMISERKEMEGSLMAQLAAGILSEGIAAQTRVREEKVPVELIERDGSVRYASGYMPPTSSAGFHPRVAAMMPEDGSSEAQNTAKVSWDEVLENSSV